jgi:hypothetical protein
MFGFGPDVLVPFFVFAIPIVAITGGITAGIVRTIGRQRLIELAQRERIAAIERGVDPSKLAPLPPVSDWDGWRDSGYSPQRRSQGLMIGGLVTLAAGLGMIAFLSMMRPDGEKNIWAVGLIPTFVGVALLISAWIVSPRGGDQAPR